MKKDLPPLFSSNETANLEGRFIVKPFFRHITNTIFSKIGRVIVMLSNFFNYY